MKPRQPFRGETPKDKVPIPVLDRVIQEKMREESCLLSRSLFSILRGEAFCFSPRNHASPLPPRGENAKETMDKPRGFFTGLKCRECSRKYPKTEAVHVCEFCFGPLEVDYDYG